MQSAFDMMEIGCFFFLVNNMKLNKLAIKTMANGQHRGEIFSTAVRLFLSICLSIYCSFPIFRMPSGGFFFVWFYFALSRGRNIELFN